MSVSEDEHMALAEPANATFEAFMAVASECRWEVVERFGKAVLRLADQKRSEDEAEAAVDSGG